MKCPACQHENDSAARFCLQCGAAMIQRCPECGTLLPLAARFCQQCGVSQTGTPPAASTFEPPRPEPPSASTPPVLPEAGRPPLSAGSEGALRLVTVLFADMSRSVQTTGVMHPEDAAAVVDRLLQAMVEVVFECGGHVDRFLGDGLLAVFGAPLAHENDPERAIRAALAIRTTALELVEGHTGHEGRLLE